MRTAKEIGRTIGLLTLAQGVGGILATFVLGRSLTTPPGFLVNAAAHSTQIGWSVLIGLATGALSVAIAICAWPLFRRYSCTLALWLLALATVGLSLAVVENSAAMSLLSLSQAYAKANGANEAIFQALRGVVAASRNWAHFTHLILGGAMFLVFYATLYRFTLIPRALAAFGLIAVILQMGTVSLPILGYRIVPLMLAPMGLAHVAVAVWLTVKGFAERQGPASAEPPIAGLARQA